MLFRVELFLKDFSFLRQVSYAEMALAGTRLVAIFVHSEDVYFARWTPELLASAFFFHVFEQHVHVHSLSCLTTERATLKLQVQLVAFSPVLVPPLVCKDGRTLLALKSSIVEHIFDHVDNSYFFMLVPAMRAMSIAATFPFVDAALACKYLTLTAADHILHHVSTDRTDKLLDLLLVLFYCIVGRQPFSVIANFIFNYALDLCAYVRYEFDRAFLCLCHLLCNRCYSYPCQCLFISHNLRSRHIRIDHC